ncbi:MAG: ribbon-helix-helix domain-containing protein [Candidatus Woesearchaeota archaeon]
MKQRITITLDSECLAWVDEKVKNRSFANRSHGFEFLIARFKERQELQNLLNSRNSKEEDLKHE